MEKHNTIRQYLTVSITDSLDNEITFTSTEDGKSVAIKMPSGGALVDIGLINEALEKIEFFKKRN